MQQIFQYFNEKSQTGNGKADMSCLKEVFKMTTYGNYDKF